MSKIEISVSVEKETYELGQAISGLVASLVAHKDQGLVGDITASVSENLGKIMTGITGADAIASEISEDPEAFANAAMLMGSKILGALLKKSPAAPVAPQPAA